MEKKKMIWGVSILFLILVIMNIGIGLIDFGEIPIALNILIPQGLILIPVLIYVLVTKQNLFQLIRFRKINFWSLLLVIPVVYLLEPLLICINAVSMAFSTNVIAGTMDDITSTLPYVAGISLMALLPAIVEETTFRGVLLNSFYQERHPWTAILFSALCFGLMHMNFNQIAYALVLGILMGIILEAGGSILATMLLHFLYNATSTSLLYLLPKLMNWSTQVLEDSGMNQQEIDQMMNVGDAATATTPGQCLAIAGMMLIPALAGAALAGFLIYAIAYLNGRQEILKSMFRKKTPEEKEAMKIDKGRVMNVILGIGMGLCVAYAILVEVLQRIG